MRRHYLIISIICFILAALSISLIGATGTPSTLIVRTDANGSLVVSGATQVNPVTSGVFASRRLTTDSNGNLQVIIGSGTINPTSASLPASTCAAPALNEQGATTTGIAFTATPSILECVAGVAVETITSTVDTWIISHAITRGTITTDLKVQDDTVTWNNAGVTFTGWKLNVTNTASNAASLLLDLQVGGASQFRVLRDGTALANFWDLPSGGTYRLRSSQSIMINSAPTIGSGFGTSPSIPNNNGTAAFTVNVGTGGTASSGVITMPAATTGWNCSVENRTGVLGNVANQRTMQIATTTTSVTVENQTISTGAALAWNASDVLALVCMGY